MSSPIRAARTRGGHVVKRIALILTLAAIAAVVMVTTAPIVAIDQESEESAEKAKEEAKKVEEKVKKGEEEPKKAEEAKEKAKEEKKEAEIKEKEEKKKKEMPKSGGFDFGAAAFLGLGATALLVRRSR